MKSFKKYLKEVAIKAEEIAIDGKAGEEYLKKELTKVLGPQYVVSVKYSENLAKSIALRIYDINPNNNIAHNSPVFMQFHMFLQTKYGKDIDIDRVSWEQTVGSRKQPNFRKISSTKSVEDANKKLVAWFKKNKSALDELIMTKNESFNVRQDLKRLSKKEIEDRIKKLKKTTFQSSADIDKFQNELEALKVAYSKAKN